MALGRSRRPGRRERNGRPQRESVREVLSVVMAQPHRRWLAGKHDRRLDQLAECELGRLRLLGDELGLTTEQYDAGVEYRRIVGRMRWAIACPPDRPTAMRLLGAYGEPRDATPEEATEARRACDDAQYAILCSYRPLEGRAVLKAVHDVAIRDLPCADMVRLRAGLNILHNHFRALTKRRILSNVRN